MKKTLLISLLAASLISCGTDNRNAINVVPYPNEVNIKAGSFNAQGAGFRYSPEFDGMTKEVITQCKTRS